MKKINNIFWGIVACALYACNVVDESDRYIQLPPVVVQKKVLMEEYTGMKCINCPAASKIIATLKDSLRENLIVVNVHTGNNARPIGSIFKYDFRTDAGTAYSVHFGGLDDHPVGMVDRTKFNGSVKLYKDNWAGSIVRQLQNTSPLTIVVENIWNEATDSLSINVQLTFVQNYSNQLALQLWVVEDSIVAPQLDGSNLIPDYVHRHMLRDCVNGIWGETFENGYPGQTITRKYKYKIPQQFSPQQIYTTVPKNCSIVAFVYNTGDNSVLQASEAKVVN